jgi:hypothetical protein
MFQKVDEFHQVPTHVDDLVITIRLTKHVRDVQRRSERANRGHNRGRVRLESQSVLDEPEAITSINYAIYDQDGYEMARGGGKAIEVLTEQELAALEKAARRVYAEAEKEILGDS